MIGGPSATIGLFQWCASEQHGRFSPQRSQGLEVCKSLAKMSSSADFSWRYKTARIVIGDETSAEEGYLHHAPPPR